LIFNFLKKNKEILSYILIGIFNNLLNYATYLIIYILFYTPFIGSFFGFSAGLISNFYLNRKFTFNSKVTFKEKFLLYLFFQLIVLLIQLFSLKLFIMLIDEKIAQIPAILISGVLNYLLLKIYIFKK